MPSAEQPTDQLHARAAEEFADDVSAGHTPSIRAIRARLHVGQPRAQRVRGYLERLASQPVQAVSGPLSADDLEVSQPNEASTSVPLWATRYPPYVLIAGAGSWEPTRHIADRSVAFGRPVSVARESVDGRRSRLVGRRRRRVLACAGDG
jgi:hypothetical protein